MILLSLIVVYGLALSVALASAGHRGRRAITTGDTGVPLTRILIVGATGGTGRQLVAQALERGCTVTALVRDPSKLHIVHPQLIVVVGDVLDEVSIGKAVKGQQAILCALGHRRYFSTNRTLSRGTQHLLTAMKAHDVRRLICETSLGVGDSAGRLGLYYTFFVIPFVLPLYFWDKARQERLVAGSGVEWVLVRPGLLTDGEKRGRCRMGPSVGNLLWTVRISRADVASFMLDQLTTDTHLGTAAGLSW